MKNKKILLIILPIVLVFAIAVVALVAVFFFTDSFKSSDVLFAKYFAQTGQVLNLVENENKADQSAFKTNNTYTGNGNLLVTVQDGTNTQELIATTGVRHDAITGRTYSELALKSGETDALKFSYINSDDVYAIKCDDITPNYIGIRNNELRKFFQAMGMSEQEAQVMPDSFSFSSLNNIAEITEEQKAHISETYSKVLVESISKDKYAKLGKTQISVDGTNYETNGYQVTIDSATLKQIVVNVLTKLKDDTITLSIISNKIFDLGITTEYTDATKLSELVGNLVTQIQNGSTNTTSSNLVIKVYEKKGTTIRTEVVVGEGKLTIDRIKQKGSTLEKAIITAMVPDQTTQSTKIITSEMTLQKDVTDASTTNTMTIIPDTSNMAQMFTMETVMSKNINNTINSSSNITLAISEDGINVQTIESSYSQNMQAVQTVEEIMELKNSNTVIVNNYTLEQLTPFLTNVSNKMAQVIPAKLAQLGINVSGTTTGGVTGAGNQVTNIVSILGTFGTAGINIANANGVNVQELTVTAIGGIEISLYSQLLTEVTDASQQMEQMNNQEQQTVEDMESMMNGVLSGTTENGNPLTDTTTQNITGNSNIIDSITAPINQTPANNNSMLNLNATVTDSDSISMQFNLVAQ